jgi:prepilin-type N-terminal cleavage/methylation domain-containing protein
MSGATDRARHAFTLMELLVALAIMAILVGLLLSGIGMIQEQAKAMATKQRIEQVHSQFAMRGQEIGNLTFYLQNNLANFGGTLEFDRATGESWVSPLGGDPWHRVFPDASAIAPLVTGYPWGKERYYHIREAWYTNYYTPPLAVNDPNTWTDAERGAWQTPEAHDITELYPLRTIELLELLGIADSAALYRDERDHRRTFNDAWGHPLVVAYAVFQPPQYEPPNTQTWQAGLFYNAGEWVRYTVGGKERRYICIRKHENPIDPSDADNQPGSAAGVAYWLEALQKLDYYLDEARRHYQYNRATYIAVGAPGTALDPVLFPNGLPRGQDAAAWYTHLTNLWSQICNVTMPNPADVWNEDSFNNPPWENIKGRRLHVNGVSIKSFLSTPIEYK